MSADKYFRLARAPNLAQSRVWHFKLNLASPEGLTAEIPHRTVDTLLSN